MAGLSNSDGSTCESYAFAGDYGSKGCYTYSSGSYDDCVFYGTIGGANVTDWAAINAVKYPPLGARSFGPIMIGGREGAGYFDRANDITACIPMIETRAAVEALDDILSLDGVDAIYVGPADPSISYGYGPGYTDDNAEYKEVLEHIVARCQAHNVVPGIHSTSSLAGDRREKGFRMQTISGDAMAIGTGSGRDLKTAREGGPGDGSSRIY